MILYPMALSSHYLLRLHIFFLCYLISSVLTVLRPRGVPLSNKIFYDPSQKFNCLDGSAAIPFHFVNDDFCDCDDGSDEPGTSACPEGKFVCCNYGHLPLMLPSSRVNDGICDCCDTSDEFNSSADCLNNCKELGLQAFNDANAVLKKFTAGNETRQVFIGEAKEKKENFKKQLNKYMETEQELLRLKLRYQDLKEKAEDKERVYLGIQKQIKQEQEKRRQKEVKLLQEKKIQDDIDARKAFEILDANEDGKITLSEVKLFKKFDYDGDGKVSEQEAQFYMHKKEELKLDEFLSNGWRVMKPAFIIEESSMDDGSSFTKMPELNNKANADVRPTASNVDENEKNAAFEEAAIRRKEFADANKMLQDIQMEIWNVNKHLSMNYGPEDEFLVLENKCFDYTDKRYIYRLCPFDKAMQIARHNMEDTLLGLWNSWCGSGENQYSRMDYTRGSTCWNGPARSVQVDLKCGFESKLLSVTESTPCFYIFVFETPASCKDVPPDVQNILSNYVVNL